jgi:hypothetical protein
MSRPQIERRPEIASTPCTFTSSSLTIARRGAWRRGRREHTPSEPTAVAEVPREAVGKCARVRRGPLHSTLRSDPSEVPAVGQAGAFKSTEPVEHIFNRSHDDPPEKSRDGRTHRASQFALCLQPVVHVVSVLAARCKVEVVGATADVAVCHFR